MARLYVSFLGPASAAAHIGESESESESESPSLSVSPLTLTVSAGYPCPYALCIGFFLLGTAR